MAFKRFFLPFIFLMPSVLIAQTNEIKEVSAKAIVAQAMVIDFQLGKIDSTFSQSGLCSMIFYYDSDGYMRKVVSFAEDGTLEHILNKDQADKLSGVTVSINSGGAIISIGIFNSGAGYFCRFYDDGRTKEVGWLGNAGYERYRANYCDNGFLYTETFYGDENDESKGYYCNGKLREKGLRLNGEKTGDWEYYDEDGNRIEVNE